MSVLDVDESLEEIIWHSKEGKESVSLDGDCVIITNDAESKTAIGLSELDKLIESLQIARIRWK